MNIEQILDHFEGVVTSGDSWKALCPAHEDNNPSLHISINDRGAVLMTCHAGCETADVLEAAGLTMRDLFSATAQLRGSRSRPEAMGPEVDQEKSIRVFGEMIKTCGLSASHKENLLHRGLSQKEIEHREYSTLDGMTLRNHFIGQDLFGVPGFVPGAKTNEWAPVISKGLVIPVRDRNGRPVALKIRTDGQDSKYIYFSGNGSPSCGAPVHFPLGTPAECPKVRVTEGELKADVIACLDPEGVPTISVPGVGQWKKAIDHLNKMGCHTVRLAFDGDWRTKPQVQQAVDSAIEGYKAVGFNVEVEVWEEKYKGLDDLLAAGGTPSVGSWDGNSTAEESDLDDTDSLEAAASAVVVQASTIQPKEVEWLWKLWLPLEAVSILDGDPGEGKSTLTMDLAARISTGQMLPGDPRKQAPGRVLFLSAEDSPSKVLVPRLLAAGANTENIYLWQGMRIEKKGRGKRTVILPEDIRALDGQVRSRRPVLVVIDPFFSYLSHEYDSHKAQDVAYVISQLNAVAERNKISILLVRHLSKALGYSGTAIYRGLGSIGIVGGVRSSLYFARPHKELMENNGLSEKDLTLSSAKSNWGPKPKTIVVNIRQSGEYRQSVIEWGQTLDVTADEVSRRTEGKPGPKGDEKQRAMAWLKEILQDGECRTVEELEVAAREAGISWNVIRRSREEAGVEYEREGRHYNWFLKGENNGREKAQGKGRSSGKEGRQEADGPRN